MGQRLNIEIVYGDESLANCYYHWSGYTDSAIALTKQVIECYEDTTPIISVTAAVRLLEYTGGGVAWDEKKRIEADPEAFKDIKFVDAHNRNDGLISVTQIGKDETRSWEEARVTVDLSTETFTFDVVSDDSEADFAYWNEMTAEECKSYCDKLAECPFDFSAIPFDKIEDLEKFVNENPYGAKQDSRIISWIQ